MVSGAEQLRRSTCSARFVGCCARLASVGFTTDIHPVCVVHGYCIGVHTRTGSTCSIWRACQGRITLLSCLLARVSRGFAKQGQEAPIHWGLSAAATARQCRVCRLCSAVLAKCVWSCVLRVPVPAGPEANSGSPGCARLRVTTPCKVVSRALSRKLNTHRSRIWQQ